MAFKLFQNDFAQQNQQYYPNADNPDNTPRVAGQATVTPTKPVAQEPVLPPKNTNNPVNVPVSNDKPVYQPITSTEELAKAMGYTSPEEEERIRKASVANQRILAIGDALRQIGNIYNTTRYAPSQQFNSPVEMERQRYLQGKALRDRANQTYISYQQAKAAQDAKQRQWKADFDYKVAKDARDYELNKGKADAYVARQGTLADLDKARQAGVISENEYKELRNKWFPKVQQATISQKQASAAASRTRAANDTKRTNAYVEKQKNSGAGKGNPYTLPTKNGYINLGRDLNSNQIGKKALFEEMKKSGIIDKAWEQEYINMFDPQEQSAKLNTAISQWLMKDDNAENYMRQHFGAQSVGSQGVGGGLNIGWDDDDEDDEYDELSIGW